ncbi:site-2 protease family protein [bacterium]|nr:site-2 protease family protein [bacterium]MBU1918634.1 site-2 protease family protein [bacterium]
MEFTQNLMRFAILMPGLLFSLSVHESAHAYTSSKYGDQTARNLGRVSLNPLVHMDPIGTVVMPILIILFNMPLLGWGKPVPVNTFKLKPIKKGIFWVSAAGPLSNLVLAVIIAILYRIFIYSDSLYIGSLSMFALENIHYVFQMYIFLNIALFLFNLIPIFPLDGSKIIWAILPRGMDDRFESTTARIGPIVLIILVFTGTFKYILIPPLEFVYKLLLIGL